MSWRRASLALPVFLVLLVVGTLAAGGLAVVLLRKEASAHAERSLALEREIAQLEREEASLNARIATAHQPRFLLFHARRMGLAVVRPDEGMLVRMPALGPSEGLAANEEPIYAWWDSPVLRQGGAMSP